MNRDRAFTLVELMAAIFVGGLILSVVFVLFVNFRRAAERPRAMAGMEESTLEVVHRLQRDLSETNLQSIRSVPSASSPGSRPGLMLESPRDDQALLQMTPFGTVRWMKFVYYQLQANGQLTRDDTTNGVQVEPGAPPALFLAPTSHVRVVAQNVLAGAPGTHDGFRACWNDPSNTAHDFEDAPTARGEPVIITLTLSDVSKSTGKRTTRQLTLKVKPQN